MTKDDRKVLYARLPLPVHQKLKRLVGIRIAEGEAATQQSVVIQLIEKAVLRPKNPKA